MHKTLRKSVAQIDIRLRIKILCHSMGETVVIGSDVFCAKYSFSIGETQKLGSLKCSESWLGTYYDEHISTFEHLHQLVKEHCVYKGTKTIYSTIFYGISLKNLV
ncbi:hypothetical protein M431DRAFT_426009 [Trichoderma harzianum CBS 226.95]|uniref:Uncharacterized protein n=1 Tax=Trichoderma harzianum CBS 226.95 TaxID=983964 RepID=A0A2T4AC70_TRIHA|nr:hypothetical protein M431DRAFT_426009 [Trichoderma harzianum CBS 226.95]PTB54681.1 hypothetical protein M431DRAFT_426009 [Trichoderma harzianum CBS 226.95]